MVELVACWTMSHLKCKYWLYSILAGHFTLSILSMPASTRPSVALCLITKDQNEDIREWVEYHRSIGVTNIIIFDNNSSKSCIHEIQDYANSGFVNFYAFFTHDDPRNKQQQAYNLCLKNFGSKFSHIGFIDTDEFIVIKNKSSNIIDVMELYQSYPGLTLNSMFFGSSGHKERPAGGVLRNYNKCTKDAHIKAIVNTKLTDWNHGPHTFRHPPGKYPVDTNFKNVEGPWNPGRDQTPSDSLFEVIYLNHYVIKSYEDFKIKHKRGSGDIKRRAMDYFEQTDRRTTSTCEHLTP